MKQVGNYLRKTKGDSGHNVRRISENFLIPERNVSNFNKAYPYYMEFKRPQGATTTRLNLRIDPVPISCTVNPPLTNVACVANFVVPSPPGLGYFSSFISNSSGEFTINGAGEIVLPRTGCYDVFWQSDAAGVITGDFSQNISVQFLHNGIIFRTVSQGPTGFVAILGPLIPTYATPSPLYSVMEAKAQDTFDVQMSSLDTTTGTPWFGGRLGGFFGGNASVTLTLIAVAEE